jgi:hypothetical protein
MRSLVSMVLLLLQLGPVAGAAVCLHDTLASVASECPMSERAHPVTVTTATMTEPASTAPSDTAPGDCALASFCLSASVTTVQDPLAVDFWASHLRVAITAVESPRGTLAGAPPLHPPIA